MEKTNNYFGIDYKYYPEYDVDHPHMIYEFFKVNMEFTDFINNHYVRKIRSTEDIPALMRDPEIYAKYLASRNKVDKKQHDKYCKKCASILSKFVENKDFFWLDETNTQFDKITKYILEGTLSCYDITYIVDNDKYMEYFGNIMRNHIAKNNVVKDIKKEIKTRKEKKQFKKRLDDLLTELAHAQYIKFVSSLEENDMVNNDDKKSKKDDEKEIEKN